jgi:P-type conjugative transfer protein TrbG
MKVGKILLISGMLIALFSANVYAEEITTVTSEDVSPAEYTQNALEAANQQAAVVFDYVPNEIYKVYSAPGYLTDIRLQSGEEITYIGGGDTVRWILDKGVVGSGYHKENHLYIKPLRKQLSTNIIINTTLHSYQIEIKSGSVYNPIVSWTYPKEQSTEMQSNFGAIKDEKMMTLDPANLNFSYKINNKSATFAPEQVFDDGRKTFLKMKKEMNTMNAPAFFVKNKHNDSVLANYRVMGNYYVIDRLFEKATLLVGTEKVEINKE